MTFNKLHTAERVSAVDASDNYVFQRSLLAYHKAAEMVSGDVLEIGTGSGYGITVIAPRVRTFITVDRYIPSFEELPADVSNVEFYVENVPPLVNIASGSCDFVITFQVIEHIEDDFAFLDEIVRVLRPAGKLIITTPNRPMSLTRNPWHVREYSAEEFSNLLGSRFSAVEALGVFGDERVMEYYHQNRQAVERVMRWDVLNLHRCLPRWMLRIPYDVANRLNRRRLLADNQQLTQSITMADYSVAPVAEGCFDLFYVATK